jgi:hypothetical protein
MPEVDLVYLAEHDQLRLSVRILNLPIECKRRLRPIVVSLALSPAAPASGVR